MNNVIDSLPPELRDVFTAVLTEHDPELLNALRASSEPDHEQRLAVEDLLSDAFSDNLDDDGEPTEHGRAIDDALGKFLLNWPIQED